MVALLQRGFSLWLLLSFAAGLFLPLQGVPVAVIPTLLGIVLFLACARITSDDLGAVRFGDVAGFYGLRFVLVPLLLAGVVGMVRPSFVVPVLLFGLLPAGVTTTAITSIVGGNPALALGTTVLSTALAPVVIPVLLGLAGTEVGLDPWGLARTLVLILLLPTALYFGVARKIPVVKEACLKGGPPVSVVLICLIAMLVAGGQRAQIFADPTALWLPLLAGLTVYAGLYGLGVVFSRNEARREQIAWTLSAGNNNIVLGLTLAVLHLPEHVLTFVAWDVAWILGLTASQPGLRR